MPKGHEVEYVAIVGAGKFPWHLIRADFCSPYVPKWCGKEVGRLLDSTALRMIAMSAISHGPWDEQWKTLGWELVGPFASVDEAYEAGERKLQEIENGQVKA